MSPFGTAERKGVWCWQYPLGRVCSSSRVFENALGMLSQLSTSKAESNANVGSSCRVRQARGLCPERCTMYRCRLDRYPHYCTSRRLAEIQSCSLSHPVDLTGGIAEWFAFVIVPRSQRFGGGRERFFARQLTCGVITRFEARDASCIIARQFRYFDRLPASKISVSTSLSSPLHEQHIE